MNAISATKDGKGGADKVNKKDNTQMKEISGLVTRSPRTKTS